MVSTRTRRHEPASTLLEELQQHRTRTLQTLRRNARTQRDRVRQEALNSLERARQVKVVPDYSPATLAHSILESVREIVVPTLASLGVEPHLNLNVAPGWAQHWLKVDTDYRTINVEMALYWIPNVIPDAKWIAHKITTIKGLVYHEAGHILYSVPFADLLAQARAQGASVPLVSEPKPGEEDLTPLYGWAYAILDDQRMESALVRTGKVFGDYLTTSILTMVVDVAARTNALGDIWPMVCGRPYLPDEILLDLRSRAFTHAGEHGLLHELNVIEHEVIAFKRATTEREMFESLDRIIPAMRAWFYGRRTYTALQYSSHRPQAARVGSLNQSPDHSLPDPAASATPEDVAAREENQAANAPREDGPSVTRGRSAGAKDASPPQTFVDEKLVDRLTPSGEVTQTMKSYHSKRVRQLFREHQVRPMTSEQISRTHEVRRETLDFLLPMTSQADPAWRTHQEFGVLDPVVYLMREPGETDYWTALDDSGNCSPNLAVSLLLDTSGSMHREIDNLFVAAIGVRLACEELNLPCTVTTFSNDSRVLFDADEPTQNVVGISDGGTNPIGALNDLGNQRQGRTQQLVIVFTDGQWADVVYLDEYRSENTVIIGVTLDKQTANAMEDHGFDEIVVVDRVSDFSGAVSHALVPYYA